MLYQMVSGLRFNKTVWKERVDGIVHMIDGHTDHSLAGNVVEHDVCFGCCGRQSQLSGKIRDVRSIANNREKLIVEMRFESCYGVLTLPEGLADESEVDEGGEPRVEFVEA